MVSKPQLKKRSNVALAREELGLIENMAAASREILKQTRRRRAEILRVHPKLKPAA